MSATLVWYFYKEGARTYRDATAATLAGGAARYLYTGNASTLKYGGRMASFAARAHLGGARAILSTTLVRGGSTTLGGAAAQFVGAVAAGYAIGSVVGTGISYLAFGEEGASAATDLYMNPGDFWNKGIMGAGDNISTIYDHYF